MELIVSKSNDNVKFIRSLNEKKYRTKYNAFYLEGVKVTNEILDKNEAIDILFIAYSKSLLISTNGGQALLDRISSLKNVKVLEFEENIFKYMTDTVNTQGILVVMKIPKYSLENEENKNIILLDKVQDLGNIGTIIRSCNAFGVDTILCTSGTADVYSPKAVRATMGGILNVKIIYLDDIEKLNLFKKMGYKIATTSLKTQNSIDSIDYNNKYIFVMGNEANGVSKEILDISDFVVKIPMSEKIESLNVGVATSIILYEQYKKTSRK